MALDARDAEVAELAQALPARVWVEQARGALVATEGLDPAAASERLRARAGAWQRTVADVAREVVQDAQRDRTAVITTERALPGGRGPGRARRGGAGGRPGRGQPEGR